MNGTIFDRLVRQRACITLLETPQFTVGPTEAVLVGMAFALLLDNN